MNGLPKHSLVVPDREVTLEQRDGRERDRTVDQQLQDERVLSSGPGGLDARVRRVLRQDRRGDREEKVRGSSCVLCSKIVQKRVKYFFYFLRG
jgi:hypothetical protein